MSAPRCPVCGTPWAEARILKRYRMYAECRCGLVGRVGDLSEGYDEDYFDTEDPSSGHRDFTSPWAEEYDRRRFNSELDHLGLPSGNRRLLDVGAATGGFVAVARERGWHATGVEPAPGARRLAASRGIDLVADVDDLPSHQTFELVTLHHVVEHLADPVDVLRTLRNRLAPTGRIVIEVPNWHSTERMASGADWVDLRPEQHRWHFTPKTLREVVRLAGYMTVELDTLSDPMPSPGTILLSLGVPLRVLNVARPRAEKAPHAVVELTIRPEDSAASRLARVVDIPVRSLRLGKRLLVVATAQDEERDRADALNISTP